ncbi:MAG: flavin reductase [Chloroflexi bacterium HGW-Chloroflexi-2]|jgi:flavin reductase (DIM6/NTAB) family NADH-FMN oxidoreductase RutF|nr:MAG: flavin reductase [Chloroflexi bacterium HGW-Chloroflexi-2]
MMVRKTIDFYDWQIKPHSLWDRQWLVLTSGDFHAGKFNSMIVGWGGFGTMWKKPFALILVRPQRYTYEYMENFDSFTLSALPEKYRKALELIGTKSGRDMNKLDFTGLTPIPSSHVSAPGLDEAELIIECRKSYYQDLDPKHFLISSITKQYPLRDYHRVYYGEILSISGTKDFTG